MPWGVAAAVAGAVVTSSMADDYGAEDANNASADATRMQAQIAKDQWNKYKEIYEPLEKQVVGEAQSFGAPSDYSKAAGDAQATVSQQYSKARDQLTRQPGVDPSSAAYQASMVGLNMAEAAQGAVQQNAARQGVQDTAYARKQSAVAMGKGLDTTASAGLGSVASSNASRAATAQAQANQQAAGIGQLTGTVVGAIPKVMSSNWLGSGSTMGYMTGQTSVSPGAVSAANNTSDPLGSLALSQGW